MLDTLARAKALAAGRGGSLSGVFYLNTLLAFPFYQLSGKFAAAGALLIDMCKGRPRKREGRRALLSSSVASPARSTRTSGVSRAHGCERGNARTHARTRTRAPTPTPPQPHPPSQTLGSRWS